MERLHSILILLEELNGFFASGTRLLSIPGCRIPLEFLFDLNTLGIHTGTLYAVSVPSFGPLVKFHARADATNIICVATFVGCFLVELLRRHWPLTFMENVAVLVFAKNRRFIDKVEIHSVVWRTG